VNLVRYADDFVVTGDSKELLETMVKPWIVEFLRERGLQFSEEKTKIVHIDEGFDFLGWNFRKYDGKMLIKPSKKNVKAFYSKVSEVIEVRCQFQRNCSSENSIQSSGAGLSTTREWLPKRRSHDLTT
jgi:hypothetical protein